MATMDIFRQDAFSMISLTGVADRLGYVPGLLSGMAGLYEPVPVRTVGVFIEEREHTPTVIPTSPRGGPPDQTGRERRTVRNFSTVRLADSSRIMADEIQGIRAYGSETELKQVQEEVARRQLRMKRNMMLTKEHMLLGMVQGLAVDADGSPIYNWATEFGRPIPAEVDFDLDNADPAPGALRTKCSAVSRSITRALKGLGGAGVEIVGLSGDTFFDDLVAHPEARESYLHQEGAKLREPVAWREFVFGGIRFINYRGTDDGSTVAVNTNKCRFFPIGAGIFQWAMSPAERFQFVNTQGQETYSWIVPDRDRDMWVDVEMYSYPLPICIAPDALAHAKRT